MGAPGARPPPASRPIRRARGLAKDGPARQGRARASSPLGDQRRVAARGRLSSRPAGSGAGGLAVSGGLGPASAICLGVAIFGDLGGVVANIQAGLLPRALPVGAWELVSTSNVDIHQCIGLSTYIRRWISEL